MLHFPVTAILQPPRHPRGGRSLNVSSDHLTWDTWGLLDSSSCNLGFSPPSATVLLGGAAKFQEGVWLGELGDPDVLALVVCDAIASSLAYSL